MKQSDFAKVKTAYLSKLKTSRDAFRSGIAGMTPQKLISNAHNIAGVQLCYKKLLKANEDEMLYLLRFRDPLMAVASGYTAMENDVAADDIFETISAMQDNPDTFRQFPQDPEWAERDDPGLRREFAEKMENCWKTYTDKMSRLSFPELLVRGAELKSAAEFYSMTKNYSLPLDHVRQFNEYHDPLAVLIGAALRYCGQEELDDMFSVIENIIGNPHEFMETPEPGCDNQ